MTGSGLDPWSALPGSVVVAVDAADVAGRAAAWLAERAEQSAAAGRFDIALAGGSTPRLMYDLLASGSRGAVDWERWVVWFGDERACLPDDEASNFRLARDHLLARVPIDPGRVHRMEAERSDLDAAASEYAALLAAELPAGPSDAPRLDVVLLGLGTNGHTASLFPGDRALAVTGIWATRGRADYAPYDRITLTVPTLNAPGAAAFVVTGAAKGPALRAVVAGTAVAARVRPVDGELLWFLDRDAAGAMAGDAPPGG